MSPFLFCLLPVPWSLFPVLCSLYPVCHSLFPVFCFLLFDSCSLSPVPCSLFTVLSPLFPIPCSIPRSLFPVPCSLFPVPRSLFLHFIPFPRSTFVFLHARKWRLFHIYSSTFIYVSLFLKQIAHFLFFYVIHISVLITLNYAFMLRVSILIIKTTVSSIMIVFKNSLFPLIYLPSCYQTVCSGTIQ